MRPSVILIRSTTEVGGCGCCRIPDVSLVSTKEDPAFADCRAIIERMGAVYQELRLRFGRNVEVQVVDPRNIALPILLVRDFFAHHVGFRDGLRTLAHLPAHGVIVNGRIVDDSDAPDAFTIVSLVTAAAEST